MITNKCGNGDLHRTIGKKEQKPGKKHRNKITKETKTNISSISNKTPQFKRTKDL